MTEEIDAINTSYSGLPNVPIKKFLDSGKKVGRIEKSLFEKMLEEQKIDVPKVDNSQKGKSVGYHDLNQTYNSKKGKLVDIII